MAVRLVRGGLQSYAKGAIKSGLEPTPLTLSLSSSRRMRNKKSQG